MNQTQAAMLAAVASLIPVLDRAVARVHQSPPEQQHQVSTHKPAASARQMQRQQQQLQQQGDTAVTAATDTSTKGQQNQDQEQHDQAHDDLIARLFGEDGVDSLDDISVDNGTGMLLLQHEHLSTPTTTTETRETAPVFVPHPVMLAQHMNEETRDQWEAVDYRQHQATLPSAGARPPAPAAQVTGGGDCHPIVVGVSSSTNAAVAAVGGGKKQHQPRKRRGSSNTVSKVSTGSGQPPAATATTTTTTTTTTRPPACNNKSSSRSKVPRISGPPGQKAGPLGANSGGNSGHHKVKLGAVAGKCPAPGANAVAPRPNTTSKVSQGNHHRVLQPLQPVPHHHHQRGPPQQQQPTTTSSAANTAAANSNPPRSLY